MAQQRSARRADLARQSDVLRTWGEIAAVLQVSRRTAIEYARRYGLPVKKAPGPGRRTAVVASKQEVSDWLNRSLGKLPQPEKAVTPLRDPGAKLMALTMAVRRVVRSLAGARAAVAASGAPQTPRLLATLVEAEEVLNGALVRIAS